MTIHVPGRTYETGRAAPRCVTMDDMSESLSLSILPEPLPDAEAEVVQLCQELIRIDSSNYGDGSGPGEAQAAEYVEARLAEVGLTPERIQFGAARREGVVVRIAGRDQSRPAFLVHVHLDVVPAQADRKSVV